MLERRCSGGYPLAAMPTPSRSTDPAKRRFAKARAEALRAEILAADERYYSLDPELQQSLLTDSEYDALFRELRALETDDPELVTPDSPTQRVGAALASGSDLPKADHFAPMLSIESLTSLEEVKEFVARTRKSLELQDDDELLWTVEPKLDGVSANLLYENGTLVRALSRGDGATGEDITAAMRTSADVPLQLAGKGPFPERIEVRGEVILSQTNFARLNATTTTTTDASFRNARNTVAGSLKLLDPAIVKKRRLEFLVWGTGAIDTGPKSATTWSELAQQLAKWGFRCAEPLAIVDGLQGIQDFHADLETRRDAIDYEMDGIVAKVDQIDLQTRLGRTARTPRWLLAFKFAPRRAITTVESVVSQVGRTGAVTPVANLAPVELAGVTVSRATLHNWSLAIERDVRPADTVEIERAGDVIPAVVHVQTDKRAKSSKPLAVPSECPSCASALETENKFVYCVNAACPAQLLGRVVHLASRRVLDIERLGPKYAQQLIDAELLTGLTDVFALPEHRDALLELERWGEKSVDKLIEEVEAAKSPTLARFLTALSIRHVGEQTAKDLAAHFGSWEALHAAQEDALGEVRGVGSEVAASVRHFFDLPENEALFRGLLERGVIPRAQSAVRDAQAGDGPLAGRIFVFTGGLSTMSRDAAREAVESRGGRTSNTVSKKATDVVAGGKAGSKLEKAERLGLSILTEDEFKALVQE